MDPAEQAKQLQTQQRIIQRQATQIGNLVFGQTANEVEIESLNEQIQALQNQKADLERQLEEAKATEKPQKKAQ
jgi:predicted  nucleic acid-binding Zn-ribbon protein